MAGILKWDLGDASNNVNANSFSHTYTSPGNKTVKVYLGTATDTSAINSINMSDDNLVGTLDLSCLGNISGGIIVDSNPKLTKIINPITSVPISSYYAYSCDLTGTIDLSGLTGGISGQLYLTSNPKLNYILCPSTNQLGPTAFVAQQCGLIGTLDLRPFKRISGTIALSENPSLNTILNSESSANISFYQACQCGLKGTLDCSGLTGLSGYFEVRDNSTKGDLNYILNPSTSGVFTSYYVQNNGLMGTLDLRPLQNLGGAFQAQNNPSLNTIYNPSTNKDFSAYYAYNCGLTGTLDLTPIKRIGGSIQLQKNPSLNSILVEDSSIRIQAFTVYDCSSLTGTFDCSGWTNLDGDFRIYNTKLTKVVLPSSNLSTNSFYTFYIYDNSITGTLNVSGITNLSGQVRFDGNYPLTEIINPTSSKIISQYYVGRTNIETLDLSGLTNLSGEFLAHFCPKLNSVKFPDSSQAFTFFGMYGDGSLASLDISSLANIGGNFNISDCSTLKTLILPSVLNQPFSPFNAKNCALGTDSIDAALTKLSARWDKVLPTGNVNIWIHGGQNSPPTNSSSNTTIAKIHTIFDNSTAYDASIVINYGLTELMFFDRNFFLNTTHSASTGINYKISFDCYLDVSGGNQAIWGTTNYPILVGGANMGVRFIGNNTTLNGKIVYFYNGSTIKYECPMMSPRVKHHIDFYYNNTTVDISLYIDSSIQQKNATSESGAISSDTYIAGWNTPSPGNAINYTLWNLDLNEEHFYEGEPAGNTEAAWADTIGTWDLSIKKYTEYAGDPSVRYAVFGQVGA